MLLLLRKELALLVPRRNLTQLHKRTSVEALSSSFELFSSGSSGDGGEVAVVEAGDTRGSLLDEEGDDGDGNGAIFSKQPNTKRIYKQDNWSDWSFKEF